MLLESCPWTFTSCWFMLPSSAAICAPFSCARASLCALNLLAVDSIDMTSRLSIASASSLWSATVLLVASRPASWRVSLPLILAFRSSIRAVAVRCECSRAAAFSDAACCLSSDEPIRSRSSTSCFTNVSICREEVSNLEECPSSVDFRTPSCSSFDCASVSRCSPTSAKAVLTW